MKNLFKIKFLLLFFLCFCFLLMQSFETENFCFAKIQNSENELGFRRYNIVYENKIFNFYSADFINEKDLSKFQKEMILDKKNITRNICKLRSFGLSDYEICNYFFPESKMILEKLKQLINVQAEPSYVKVEKNKCNLLYYEGESGKFIDKENYYNEIFRCLMEGNFNISILLKTKEYNDEVDIFDEFKEKSCFLTKFSTSSAERKNNIKLALSKFDGLVLDEGEILSFNKTTGIRNEKAGYMAAKIISNGTFVDGFGGGVCQVSTTLYNACLLAGLEVLEVHNHSLPVSYIEPSFDAMVNSGSSDLIIRNNTDGKLIFTTSSEGDVCKIKIYGKKNKYKITRISEKIKIIPAEAEIIDENYEKYGLLDLQIGETKRLSYAKEGYFSNAYLNYYDEKGNLVETKKIRENRYNPTKGIIVKREK